ncbi:MAG: hypothetical protein HYX48_04845 [Chlamydiales bacterium]|nr:hypothetical protein [Chlamydiales bacterium]
MSIRLTHTTQSYMHTAEMSSDPFLEMQPSPDELPCRKALRVRHYEAGRIHLPAMSNIIFTPIDIITTILAWTKAKVTGDDEGQFDAQLRMAGMPLSLMHAASALFSICVQIGLALEISFAGLMKPFTDLLTTPTLLFGLGLCLIETGYESVWIKRARKVVNFANREENQQDQQLIATLSYFDQKYLALTPAEEGKIRVFVQTNFSKMTEEAQRQKEVEFAANLLGVKRVNLERRVRPWCAEKLSVELEPLIEVLGSKTTSFAKRMQARAEAVQLIKMIDMQGKKNMLVHVIGVTALALSGVGFACSIIACPFIVPLILLIAGGVIGIVGFFYGQGIIDEKDWSFSWKSSFGPLYELIGNITSKPPSPTQEIELLPVKV